MIQKQISILLVFISCIQLSFSQANIPTDYFDNPLKIPLILSGSFGELRSNHFHSGLDIKTQQREGIAIYAPADGYVSRIKVGHFGFGKALYLKHPNGYSTVYAHLQKYEGAIQHYVKNAQYKNESYEIELFPSATDLLVKKGDLIGYTGNSGSSGGPHLHFEIRDASSRPMNPMLFGIEIPDTQKPLINSVYAYPVAKNSVVNGQAKPVKLRLTRLKDGTYKAEKLTGFGAVGFGVSSYDQQNGASNKNGVYQINTAFNGTEKINIVFEKFSFDETRYLNRYIDYNHWKENKSRVQKLFREPNNPLSIIKNEDNKGLIELSKNFKGLFTIEVCDFKNNKIVITIPVEGLSQEEATLTNETLQDPSLEYIIASGATNLKKGKFDVYIPADALYEDTYLNIQAKGDTLTLHKDVVPIHKNISISVDISNYDSKDRSNLYLGRLNYRGVPYYTTTTRIGNTLTAKTRTFGDYAIVSDTKAPSIKPINFSDGKWITNNKTLRLKITDYGTGINKYRATINGKFILTEYDYKKDVLVYDFDDAVVTDTAQNLKVIVIDNAGNSSTFEATFFRKNN